MPAFSILAIFIYILDIYSQLLHSAWIAKLKLILIKFKLPFFSRANWRHFN